MRLCKDTIEAVSDNMCAKLTTRNYLKRHNNIATTLHINICQHYEMKISEIPWKHHPEPVTENKEVKVLWDFEVRTDTAIPTQRQDVQTNKHLRRSHHTGSS